MILVNCLVYWLLLASSLQVIGIGGATRIRFPQVMDGRASLPDSMFLPGFNDSDWQTAVNVASPPWPAYPPDVETPPQLGARIQSRSLELLACLLATACDSERKGVVLCTVSAQLARSRTSPRTL